MKTIRTTCSMIQPIVADYNVVIEGVPDPVADMLVKMGNAVILADEGPDPQQYEPSVAEKLAQEYAPVLAAGPEPREGELEPVTVPESDATFIERKRPYGNSSKQAWIDWAVYQDPELTGEVAQGMSKVYLMSTYGERL